MLKVFSNNINTHERCYEMKLMTQDEINTRKSQTRQLHCINTIYFVPFEVTKINASNSKFEEINTVKRQYLHVSVSLYILKLQGKLLYNAVNF